jgi:3-hydroxyisobutyrate dehydrogenase-like beta-hydroxyacid dehydrogenase
MEAFASLGGTPTTSPADAAHGAHLVVTCLMTGAVVREVLFGRHGAAEAMSPGSLVIDTTTCAPAESTALAADLGARGIGFVDAPLSGSSADVRAGRAVVLAGGTAQDFARCRPLFRAIARRAFHLGPHGAGATAKLVTNLVLGLNRWALAEGLALGLRCGLPPAALLSVLRESAAYSRVMETKGEKMVAGRFEADARLQQHLKDVTLILELGGAMGVPLPVSALHQQLLTAAVAQGWGNEDNSAIIKVLQMLASP